MDRLVWNTAKLVAMGYDINKLQIICLLQDGKLSTNR